MSDVATLIADLVASGVSPDLVGRVAQAIAEASAGAGSRDEASAKRSARNARYYDSHKDEIAGKRQRLKPSESQTIKTSENRLTASESQTVSDGPRAHVRDNPSRLVISGNHTTLHCADAEAGAIGVDLDWPHSWPPSSVYLDELKAALFAAAGPAISPTSPNIHSLAPILALAKRGQGPPCDLQMDVLMAVRVVASRTAPGKAKSWEFFVPAIRETRDRRLQGAPATEIIPIGRAHERHHDSRSEGRSVWSEIAADEAAARAGSG